MAAARKARHESRTGRRPLTPAKATVFLLITLSLPFVLFAALEAGLRSAGYGGSLAAFDTPENLAGRYRIPSASLGRRYFPRERFPPSPPADAFLIDKPPNSLRIFVLGESSAAGFPYPANGTFSRVLRDALSDVLPDDTVEVVNLGMAATNSYTIADVARDVVREQPDAVIIYGGHNEYYGALGAGSTETLGAFPGLVHLYLRLQHLRSFLLLRNVTSGMVGALRGGRSTAELERDATRMEGVVGEQRIPFGSKLYARGVEQYQGNLLRAANAFRAAGAQVFIGSTPSNIRDLKPFGASLVPPDSAAMKVFDSAVVLLRSGDSARAARLFSHARDLDVVRFRAPSDFQPALQELARKTGAVYVPVLEEISSVSRFGIPGSDIFLEHVHPDYRGYAKIAESYYAAIARAGFLGRRADTSRLAGWDSYLTRMRLTELDHRIAFHTVRTVTTRWPFVPIAQQSDYRGTYRPRDFLDSVAFHTSRGGMPWAQAKGVVAARFAADGEVEKAVAEYEGLIRDGPRVEVAYRLAGRVLLGGNQPERARPYLEKAYSLTPTSFTAYALGLMAMQAKNTQRAIPLFEQALALQPDMPEALYQLSLAHAAARNLESARGAAARLAQVAPRYPGLHEWLAILGMTR